jgi:hypothetical protein
MPRIPCALLCLLLACGSDDSLSDTPSPDAQTATGGDAAPQADAAAPSVDADIPQSEFAAECAAACANDEDATECTATQLGTCSALCAEATAGLGESCGTCMVSETGVLVVDCQPDIPAIFECPDDCAGDADGPASFALRCRDACENNDWASTCSAGEIDDCATACLVATDGKSQRCGSCIVNFSSLVEGCVADIADADLCSGSCAGG